MESLSSYPGAAKDRQVASTASTPSEQSATGRQMQGEKDKTVLSCWGRNHLRDVLLVIWTMLSRKLALITGGGNGIGRATCQLFAEHGASVIVADVQKKSAEETRESLASKENHHSSFHVDVSGANFVEQLKDAVLNEYDGKPPDIVVNSAGVIMDAKLHDMDEHAFDWVMDINLKGPFLVTKIFSKAMIDAKLPNGSIINISSIIGKTGNYGQANYAASKAGLIGLTKTVARELARYNVRCNAVMPGYINTAMAAKVKPKLAEMILKQIPLGRMGDPKEIAATCLFLASDLSTYMTGATIEVTGGLYM